MSYAITGNKWSVVSPVTYSFAPDGTDILGNSSDLFATWDPIGNWQDEVRKAFARWSDVAAIDFAEMTDDGSPFGTGGYQQGDARFGDIRIGGMDLTGPLGIAGYPPPINGGTNAGDIIFNTSASWQINSSYDILSLSLHEIGHAIGIGHSPDNSNAVMYPGYNSVKQDLQTDDINAVLSIYGVRGDDRYETNNSKITAYEVGSFYDGGVGNSRIAFRHRGLRGNSALVGCSSLGRLGPRAGIVQIADCAIKSLTDVDWFTQIIRPGNPGSFTVVIQSKYFSMFKPRLIVYDADTNVIGDVSATQYGGSISCVVEGQAVGARVYVRVLPASPIEGKAGRYGLLWNMGSDEMTEIPRPVAQVEAQADQEGDKTSELIRGSGSSRHQET